MSPRWQRLVRRNISGQVDPAGEVYGAPYRCAEADPKPQRLASQQAWKHSKQCPKPNIGSIPV